MRLLVCIGLVLWLGATTGCETSASSSSAVTASSSTKVEPPPTTTASPRTSQVDTTEPPSSAIGRPTEPSPPVMTFRESLKPDPEPLPVPEPTSLGAPGARVEVGGSWSGEIKVAGAGCVAKYGFDAGAGKPATEPSLWEFSAGNGVGGSDAVDVQWGTDYRAPTVTISFRDIEGTAWTASALGEGSGTRGPYRYATSPDNRTVSFSGVGVARPEGPLASDLAISQISTVTITGKITCQEIERY